MSDNASAKKEFYNRLKYGQKFKPWSLQDAIDDAQRRIKANPHLYGMAHRKKND